VAQVAVVLIAALAAQLVLEHQVKVIMVQQQHQVLAVAAEPAAQLQLLLVVMPVVLVE
jgi:hypothetical protein